jgi:hypothetical protein
MENQYFINKNENGNYVIANKEGETLFGLSCSLKNPCKKCKKCINPKPNKPNKPIKPTSVMDKVTKALKSVNTVSMSTTNKVVIGIAVVSIICIAIFIYFYLDKNHKEFKLFTDAESDDLVQLKPSNFELDGEYVPYGERSTGI